MKYDNAYKIIDPHEPHPHAPRMRKPTEEEKKIIEEHAKFCREQFQKAFPHIDYDKLTFKPNKK